MSRSTAITWALYSLREVLNDSDMRNSVLRSFLGDLIYQHSIHLGRTFVGEYDLDDLRRYMASIVDVPGVILFTASNPPDQDTNETHFLTFIVYNQYTPAPGFARSLIVIDPSEPPVGSGIYNPYIADFVVVPFFEARGYGSYGVNTNNACQVQEDDVFCQSWSLYLQIQAVRNPLIEHVIPPLQRDKYALLLSFFKTLLALDMFVCNKLREQYRENIMTHRALVEGVPKKRHGALRATYLSYDPCRVVMEMAPDDMFGA